MELNTRFFSLFLLIIVQCNLAWSLTFICGRSVEVYVGSKGKPDEKFRKVTIKMFGTENDFNSAVAANQAMNWEQVDKAKCCSCCRDLGTPVSWTEYCVKTKQGFVFINDGDYNKKIHTQHFYDRNFPSTCCIGNPGLIKKKVKVSDVNKI
ncbi:uncharacterized protein LOC116344881 [Contarinia nasturtii]|uniref:uncharacterized protein LOC116344881 n=1 Tax=Contarinia nasturtii TaxID=265458 RepID=UPI0012D3C4A0|nr:uncharacterized protein LOC116344881 [Contarinia nasturtii]